MVQLLLLFAASVAQAEFRAAVSKVDITPSNPQWLMGYGPRQSTGVHDRIYHRVVALDDGRTQLYIVSTDVCVFSPGFYDEAAAEIKRDLGIEPRALWWTVTHTHSAPEVGPRGVYDALLPGRSEHEWDRDYARLIQTTLKQALQEAKGKLAPARLGVGTGMAVANINRRARDVDGRISLGLNPAGPADRQIGLLRLDRPDGTPIALIANYAMHGTVLGGNYKEISGDAQGIVADYVEKKIGAPMLYVNGAAGNMAPIYSVYNTPAAGHLSQFGVLLGDPILTANGRLKATTPDVKIQLSEKIVETRSKPEIKWPPELPQYQSKDGRLRIPVRFAVINDTLLWAAPVEMFCEIAMRVRQESNFTNTFYYGYTNGWLGYLPTAAGFREGGYEPRTTPFTEEVERDFTEAVLTHVAGLAPAR